MANRFLPTVWGFSHARHHSVYRHPASKRFHPFVLDPRMNDKYQRFERLRFPSHGGTAHRPSVCLFVCGWCEQYPRPFLTAP